MKKAYLAVSTKLNFWRHFVHYRYERTKTWQSYFNLRFVLDKSWFCRKCRSDILTKFYQILYYRKLFLSIFTFKVIHMWQVTNVEPIKLKKCLFIDIIEYKWFRKTGINKFHFLAKFFSQIYASTTPVLCWLCWQHLTLWKWNNINRNAYFITRLRQ